MDVPAILTNGLWAGLFASFMGMLLTAPRRYIVPTFICAFAGRLARDLFVSLGMTLNWSTAAAAAVVVLLAVMVIRRHVASPVVVISGILPLGAAIAVFDTITGLMKVSSLQGSALTEASVALIGSAGKAFTTTLAIALGVAVGITIVRVFSGRGTAEI